jgi:4-amino-4-deoxy-L-arabinose transferase-like glycosyltransferase
MAPRLALLIGIMSVLRATAAAAYPLLASEAYYWLWGQHLALGYFDHPPMTGWVSRLCFGWIYGSQLAARSGPIILGAVTTLIVYRLGTELFGSRRAGWRAALLFGVVPIFDAGCVLIQPDNGLMCFMALTWLLFWRATQRGTAIGPWLLTGVAAGLALLSKFHAWVMLPPLYLFLLISRNRMRLLATPGPWLAIVVALAVLSPNLVWNAHHGWITYGFQAHRSGLGDVEPSAGKLASYLAAPLLSLSPLVYVACIAAAAKALARWNDAARPELIYLFLAGAPLPLFFLTLSPLVSISLHWPALGYVPLTILAVGMIERGGLFGRRYEKAMLGVAIAMAAFLHLTPLIIRYLPDHFQPPLARKEVNTGRLRAEMADWGDLGRQVRELFDKFNDPDGTLVLTPDYHLAAQLAFYSELPNGFDVLAENREHVFSLWEGTHDWQKIRHGIVLYPYKAKDAADFKDDDDYKALLTLVGEQFVSHADGPTLMMPDPEHPGAKQPTFDQQHLFHAIYGEDYLGDRAAQAPVPQRGTMLDAAEATSTTQRNAEAKP